MFSLLLSGLVMAQAQAESSLKGQEVLRVRIGSGPGELGVVTPEEANPEGPMSFAVGSGGEIYVLDQTNSRIQVFKEGQLLLTIPIPGSVFIDIELLPGGLIALLDNVVDKIIIILDQTGRVVRKISLER